MKKVINAFIFQFVAAFPVQYFINNHIITIRNILITALIGTVIMLIVAQKHIIKII